jgi:hypothetical protein
MDEHHNDPAVEDPIPYRFIGPTDQWSFGTIDLMWREGLGGFGSVASESPPLGSALF